MYTVGMIAKLLGVSIDTIRHYKDLQILHPNQLANGYFKYNNKQALITLIAKEMSSLHMPLADIKHTIENESINQFNDSLDVKKTELEMKLKRLQDELIRLEEIKKYTSYGINRLNSVDEFHGTDIYLLPLTVNESSADKFKLIKEWINYFPFTYISVSLSKEEIDNDSFDKNYTPSVGIGVTKKYFEGFSFTSNQYVNITTGGLCLRTCIAVEDPFSISPKDINILKVYAKTKGYRFTSNTSGRLLFIKNADTKPLYYILIWARVEAL